MDNEVMQAVPAQVNNAAIAERIQQPSNVVVAFSRTYRLGEVISTASIIPDSYKGKPADCTIAIDMADRIGVSPMMVMQNLYAIKGKPSWSGQACHALVEGCGKFKYGSVRPVFVGEKGADTRGCYMRATWKDTGEVIEGPEVNVKMAKAEGWYSKNSKWANMPELMLAYRAAAFFARVYCPEVLMGVHVEGEVEDIHGDRENVQRVEL